MVDGVYSARTIKWKRRTRGEVEQLERQILAILEEDHPQSARHIFYRLTDPRLPEPVPKSELGYRAVQNRLKLMRRAGAVHYGWITDATRHGYHTVTYTNGAEFFRRHIGAYRADLWADAGAYVEVWCESRSIAGVIVDLCEELAVSLYPAGGFSSITFAYEAAKYIRADCGHWTWPWIDGEEPPDVGEGLYKQTKAAHVLYIGDYDPAGVLIDVALETELRHHLPANFNLHFQRLAIIEEQVAEYDLPTKPRKETDRRAQHVKATVEAEALPASILREIYAMRSSRPAGARPGGRQGCRGE